MRVRRVASLLVLCFLAGNASRSAATVVVVDSTADAPDANAGDGACATAAGECSLRAAIEETNALNGHDAIVVPAGTYVLGYGGAGGAPYGATLTIMDDLDVLGAGATSTVIDGAGLFQVVHVWLNANRPSLPRSRVLLRDLTVANGNGVTGPNAGISGAGILNQGTLTVESCIVRDNNGHLGSAIVNLDTSDPDRHPRLTMRDTEVRDNVTQTNGAGLTVPARTMATVEGCVFSGNHADGPGSLGGAIAIGGKGKLVVEGSQFTGNSAGLGGGAIAAAGSARISDSVFSGNTTTGNGGGILRIGYEEAGDDYYRSPGPLRLTGTTITGNRADSDDSGSQFGGGVMSGSPGLVRVDTTISGNFGTGGAADDCTCFR
jgi:CSLREA domain-containing protein